MQDLSAKYNPPGAPLSLLVPSSQEGGNLIQADLAQRTMTAPGSEPVSPLPPGLDGAHPTPTQSGDTVPVSFPGDNPRPEVHSPGTGNPKRWGDINVVGGSRRSWKQTV